MDLIFFFFLNFLLQGVYSVNVEAEKKLVTVVGSIDPVILIKGIERWIGSAELLYYKKNRNRKVGDDHGDKEEEEEFRSSKNVKVKSHEGDHSKKERMKESEKERNHGSSNAAKHKKKKKKDDGGHVIEAYEPPKIDPTICRDPYCKLHKLRPIFHSKVPSRHSADHPHHTDGYSFPTRLGSRSSIFDGPFPYDHHTMMEPPSSFGYHPGTYFIPGFDNFSGHGGDAAYFRGRYM